MSRFLSYDAAKAAPKTYEEYLQEQAENEKEFPGLKFIINIPRKRFDNLLPCPYGSGCNYAYLNLVSPNKCDCWYDVKDVRKISIDQTHCSGVTVRDVLNALWKEGYDPMCDKHKYLYDIEHCFGTENEYCLYFDESVYDYNKKIKKYKYIGLSAALLCIGISYGLYAYILNFLIKY